MDILLPWACVFGGLVVLLIYVLVAALLKAVDRVTQTNKQLMLIVAGKDNKPETLRALVASEKLPKKPLPGIANKEKEEKKKSPNKDYVMNIGGQ